MQLVVYLPTRKVLDAEVASVQAEDPSGGFGLRPGHEPLVTALTTGLVRYEEKGGGEGWVAVDEGFLVADGGNVEVYAHDVHVARDAAEIRRVLEERFQARDQEERERKTALLRMQLAAFRMLFGYER